MELATAWGMCGTISGMDATTQFPGGAEKRVLQSRVICILWHAPGSTIDPELERSLKRWQGLVVTECRSAPAAIAEVMSIERVMRGGKREPTVLLLVEPERLAGVADVLSAIDRFSPTTRCWCFVPESAEMLRAVTPRDIAAWTRASAERLSRKSSVRVPEIAVVAAPRTLRSEPVVDRSSRRGTGSEATEKFEPRMPVELDLAETLLERPAVREARVDPDYPDLHVEEEAFDEQTLGKKSTPDNSTSGPGKWGGGVSNVLTADEMAMLLAEDDERGHT